MKPMKYVTVLTDGMSDYPDKAGRTPMSTAKKPTMDSLAACSEVGLVQTVPEGMKPGSDVANLSVMGYDPQKYYTGRSPLEALSIGVPMRFSDVTYRLNFVTLSDAEPFEKKKMVDYSAGEITSTEAAALIDFLKFTLPLEGLMPYAGVSYRHCMLRERAELGAVLTPPHDFSGKEIKKYLPQGAYANEYTALIRLSYDLLHDHPINKKRIEEGKNPANAIWLWGEGRKPQLDDFKKLYGISGAVISAVDLIKGIAAGAGLDSIEVEGATGNLNTNYEGKAAAAIEALKTHDYVYVHIEAPDECGHQGDFDGKTRAIELIDEKVIAPILKSCLDSKNPFRLSILPDHATPVALGTHTSDPVPYILFDSETMQYDSAAAPVFTEDTAKEAGRLVESGPALFNRLIGR